MNAVHGAQIMFLPQDLAPACCAEKPQATAPRGIAPALLQETKQNKNKENITSITLPKKIDYIT